MEEDWEEYWDDEDEAKYYGIDIAVEDELIDMHHVDDDDDW